MVRNDTFDRPVVIRKGSVYVTAGTDRRSSGTHYTPRSLTEPIVQYTLEPLVYIGPAEGMPKEEWRLRSAKELLDLKICDMARGSGAFLVQVCRYLAERLLEAWEDAEKRHPGVPGITPEGAASTGAANEQLIPKETDERLAYARRIVAQRCLYGVDKNPLAVEMAKLSLWLLTLAKDKPFSFLDHAIRCGDSLVGIRDIRQAQYFQLDLDHADRSLFAGPVMGLVDEAVTLRKSIEALPANTVEDVREKERLLKEAEDKTARLRYAADLLISVEFQRTSARGEKDDFHNHMAIQAGEYVKNGTLDDFRDAAKNVMNGQPTFHWPLEFPEVFLDRGGFDAFVCNPPFMGGNKVSATLGPNYREYLRLHLAQGFRGSADLRAYFFLRAGALVRIGGASGLIATNTIAQGITREVGLERLLGVDYSICRAISSSPWPAEAALAVAHVWLFRGGWRGKVVLDNSEVTAITAYLSAQGITTGSTFRLAANAKMAFQGPIPLGKGFLLDPTEAEALIAKKPSNAECLWRYMSGEDMTTRPDQSPSRWVINFQNMPLEHASRYSDCFAILNQRVRPYREALVAKGGHNGQIHERDFWKFWNKSPDLQIATAELRRVICHPFTSKYISFCFCPVNHVVIAGPHNVFATDSWSIFALLSSSFHVEWAFAYGSTHETRLRYAYADLYETFALPVKQDSISRVGENYHELRQQIMLSRQEGLTKTYNRFHDPSESDADIQRLRDLQVEMDQAVAAAYGWTDLNLDHGFHEIKQGTRFTISESARREVLSRLLKLNHERYAEEVKQGLHDKKGKAKPASSGRGRKSKASTSTPSLNFGDDEDDPDPPDNTDVEPTPTAKGTSPKATRADRQVQPTLKPESPARPTPIDEIDTDDVMAAFRQVARGKGWLERDELLKEVSLVLGYQRLGPRIDEALRGHLRAAIRRRIIETEGASLVRAGAVSMADYEPDELVEVFRSVMRKGTSYDREEVIPALARHLGFVRLTDSIREPIRDAITRAIRHGLLGYEGSLIWRGQ